MKIKIHYISLIFAIIGFQSLTINAQTNTFYNGIDTAKGIGWKNTPTMYPNFKPEYGIKRTEFQLEQSDFIIILNCKDSSLIDSVEWIKTKEFRETNYNDIKKTNSIDKENHTLTDTIYIESQSNSIIFDPSMRITTDQLFFELKEVVRHQNFRDSTVMEFYSLDEVTGICISGYYFRRKCYKNYINGKPHGTWIYYNIYGEIERKTEYKMGEIIKDEQN